MERVIDTLSIDHTLSNGLRLKKADLLNQGKGPDHGDYYELVRLEKHLSASDHSTSYLYMRYPEAAEALIAEKGSGPFRDTYEVDRHILLKKNMRRMLWKAARTEGSDLFQISFDESKGGYEPITLWANLCYEVLIAAKAEDIRINPLEISCRGEFLLKFLNNYFVEKTQFYDLYRRRVGKRVKACMDAIDKGFWPLRKVGDRYEFNPVDFNFLLADNILVPEFGYEEYHSKFVYTIMETGEISYRINAAVILERLDRINFFERDDIQNFKLFLSLIAERVLLHNTNDYENFDQLLEGIAQRIGGRDGFDMDRAILRDLKSIYILAHPEKSKESDKYMDRENILQALTAAGEFVASAQRDYFYPEREVVLSTETMERALTAMKSGGSSAFYEEVFTDTVTRDGIEELFPERVRPLIRRVIESARKRRKAEAAVIPVFADTFGFDCETAIWLGKVMKAAWAAIIMKDDVYDGHEQRDGEDTVQMIEGPTNAAEKALYTILQVTHDVVQGSRNRELDEHFTKMSVEVYEGDLEMRNIGWVEERKEYNWNVADYRKNYDESLRKMAGIFSWFPRYAGAETGFSQIGEDFAQAMKDFGYLILAVNDIEDIAQNGEKHEVGNDVGQKMSLSWWQFMHLELEPDDPYYHDLAKDQAKVAKVFNDLAQKRRFWEKLDEADKIALQEAVVIGRKYLPRIIQTLRPEIEAVYLRAIESLNSGFDRLPAKDKRNALCLEALNKIVDEVWLKFNSFRSENGQ